MAHFLCFEEKFFAEQDGTGKQKIGICRGKPGIRTTLSFRASAHYFRGNLHRISGSLSSYRPFFFVLFPGIYLCVIEKWYSYPGDCHTRKADWFAMTGNSTNFQFPALLHWSGRQYGRRKKQAFFVKNRFTVSRNSWYNRFRTGRPPPGSGAVLKK